MKRSLLLLLVCIVSIALLAGCDDTEPEEPGNRDEIGTTEDDTSEEEPPKDEEAVRPPGPMTQEEAALIMVGCVLQDALLTMSFGPERRFVEKADATGYMTTAGVPNDLVEKWMEFVEDGPTAPTSTEKFNTTNVAFQRHAKAKSPAIGQHLHSFGMSLQFWSLLARLGTNVTTMDESDKEKLVETTRAAFTSPFGRLLFESESELPLPEQVTEALRGMEAADTSTLEGCIEVARQIDIAFRTIRALALYGEEGLERVGGSKAEGEQG